MLKMRSPDYKRNKPGGERYMIRCSEIQAFELFVTNKIIDNFENYGISIFKKWHIRDHTQREALNIYKVIKMIAKVSFFVQTFLVKISTKHDAVRI
mgnify:CR=1 FL=1